MPSENPRRRRRIIVGVAVLAIVALLSGGAVFALTRGGDVSNPEVAFDAEPTPTPVPEPTPVQEDRKGDRDDPADDFVWAHYGYSKDRRRYLPASSLLRPPYTRVWSETGAILLEFGPAIGGRWLYLLKNNGALYAINKDTGTVRWKRKLGHLAAASPVFGGDTVYASMLERGKGIRKGSVVAVSAKTGKVKWRRDLPSRTESQPLLDADRIYLGSENGTVYSLRASDGAPRWTFKAAGAVKGGPALANGKLYFGDYKGRVYAIRQADGRQAWVKGTSGAKLGLSSGQFYSTPAVAYGRVYIGNTDGNMYSYSTADGKLAWSKGTDGYVYASPAVAQVPGFKPTVYFGSYNGTFYALDAKSGKARWSYRAGGKISGGATVIGDIVYFANLGKKDTIGLGARTGRKVFRFPRGSFNPVVSDGRMLFLTGYSSLYGLRPLSQEARREEAKASERAAARRSARRRATRSACRRRAERIHDRRGKTSRSYWDCVRRNDAQKRK